MLKELITEVKRIIHKKETVNGDYFIKFRGSNNVIVTGFVFDNPETLDNQELVLQGVWKEINAQQENVFEFKSYQLKDTMKYFFNKVIKIPTKALNEILKKNSIRDLEEILDTCPMELITYKGIGESTIKKITHKWKTLKFDKELYNQLTPFNFSNTIISNIKDAIGSAEKVLEILDKDPYELVQIDGVTFNKIDEFVLRKKHFPLSFRSRLVEGIKYSAKRYMDDNGDTIINMNELFLLSKRILDNNGFNYDLEPFYLHEIDFVSVLESNLDIDFSLIKDNLTLTSIYEKEKFIFDTIKEKANIFDIKLVNNIEEWIDNKEIEYSIKLSNAQREIIKMANTQPSIFSLSGYAGTGKTRVSQLIMNLYAEQNKSIHCCALSGVASNRIKLVSKFDSKTIHSLLGFDGITYSFNENNTLPYELIVLDECGMVNSEMFYHLIKAINWKRTKLFIIGDPAQLLPVGLGNVYNDLLLMNMINNITLTDVFRQQGGSIINIVAQHIRQFQFPKEYHIHNSLGFYTHFVPFERDKETKNKIIMKEFLKTLKSNNLKSYNEDNLLDLQIIAPTKNGDFGTINLNNIIQEVLNSNETLLEVKGVNYKINDKVIHLRNIKMEIFDNENGNVLSEDKIYNGQIGIVKNIIDNSIWVYYPYEKQLVCYEYDLIKMGFLGLAYALTAHKCQGNEFKDVIMTVVYSDINMLNANYLYSAMTRSKENLHLVGELSALLKSLENKTIKNRKTILRLLEN